MDAINWASIPWAQRTHEQRLGSSMAYLSGVRAGAQANDRQHRTGEAGESHNPYPASLAQRWAEGFAFARANHMLPKD